MTRYTLFFGYTSRMGDAILISDTFAEGDYTDPCDATKAALACAKNPEAYNRQDRKTGHAVRGIGVATYDDDAIVVAFCPFSAGAQYKPHREQSREQSREPSNAARLARACRRCGMALPLRPGGFGCKQCQPGPV